MARKLRPDEVRAFDEKPDVAGPASDPETLLNDSAEKPNRGLDFTTIDPVWIKSSLPDPFGS